MSREFGDYQAGYFHQKLESCASDCCVGRDPLTKLWGGVLKSMGNIAWSISSSEACDSGPGDSIIQSIRDIDSIQKNLDAVKEFIRPYEQVAKEAVRLSAQKDHL